MPSFFTYSHTGKRLLDLFSSFLGIIVLSPVLLLVSLLVKLGDGGAVIYRQRRIGRDFEPFEIYKFRTMSSGADSDGNTCTVKGDSRITKVGNILRKTKLDELPQLFNVLKGDMSLVGPRPEVARYVDLFRKDYELVLTVRPGITDYAAIEYRNEEEVLGQLAGVQYSTVHDAYVAVVLPAKIALYKRYLTDLSFGADLKIISATVFRLLK